MYLSERIRNLFADKARFERAYRSGFLKKSVEFAMAQPELATGYWQIMSWFDRQIANAIKDEETSKVLKVEN